MDTLSAVEGTLHQFGKLLLNGSVAYGKDFENGKT